MKGFLRLQDGRSHPAAFKAVLALKGEGDCNESSAAVDPGSKGQEHGSKVLVPFAFGFVLSYLG